MLGSTFSDLGCSHLDTYPWCMRGRGSRLEGCLERLSDPHYLASALSQCGLNKRLSLRLLFCCVPSAKYSAGLSHSHPSWSRRGLIAEGAKGSRAWGFNLLVVTKLHNPGSASTPWVPSRFSQWLLGSLFYERLPLWLKNEGLGFLGMTSRLRPKQIPKSGWYCWAIIWWKINAFQIII